MGGGVTFSATPAIVRPKPQGQVYIAKGVKPWYNSGDWSDKDKVINTDESISGQATVTCKGVTNMANMFYKCSKLTSIDLFSFDTSNVTNMHSTFSVCSKLTSLDLSSFDTSNVTNMSMMFYYCPKLTALDLSSFDTSKVTDMSYMFYDCSSLTTIKGVIDMKSIDTTGIFGDFVYSGMFYNCPNLRNVKIKNPPSGFDGAGLSKSQYTIVS